jgi:nitrogen-specific signal transduction histidine kinase/CheY-like chemotaxis protein
MRDVTREEQMEEQFRSAQKMEALGRLAGSVAHDFNNFVTVVHLSTRMMERKLHPEDPIWKHVQRIQKAGEHATSLTKQLLSFSRGEVGDPYPLNLNDIVSEISKMLGRVIGEDIELVMALEEDLWSAHADPTQIDQVIMNLVVNARDAMPSGGVLTIETSNVVLDDTFVAEHVGTKPGEHVMLAVSDTGEGMEEEVKARVFEPFFTTKEAGMGTGLGLATVFGIIKQLGGHIWVYSELGRGTSFKIYLPRADDTATTSKALPAAPESLRTQQGIQGKETILLVEDRDDVRESALLTLEVQGYRVLAAKEGTEALKISETHKGPIDVLLTDMIMPGMSGKDLSKRIQELRPEIRVLYMSGYTDKAMMSRGILDAGEAFLPKPFSLESLSQSVRSLLEGED